MEETRRQAAVDIEHYLFDPESTDLPAFTVLEFSGHEGISQLTHFDIRLLADDQDIDPADILNKRASLKIWCWQDSDYSRVYHGIISSFQQIGQDERTNRVLYQVHMVPLLWRLGLNYQSRIFQEKSVPEIIEEVFEQAGFQQDDYRLSLNGTYLPLTDPPREFCVQYRETDFNFVSRLMEEEGIFYFFEYNDDKEVMVIADHAGIHTETSPMSEVPYEEPTGLQSLEAEYIHPMQYRVNVISTDFTLTDFNYNTPQTQLSSPLSFVPSTQVGGFLQDDYPGHFGFPDRGGDLVTIRSQEVDTGRRIISGKSNCRSFRPGYLFTLTDHPNGDLADEDYLLTRVSHHGVQPGTMATDVQISYENQFEAIPAPISDFPYRPPRVTPKARVQGTHTAIVVGPAGEELYMDEKGRAKIQFHWDLAGGNDENSSCWVRVSHGYAGQNHGIQFHPLVGDEVIVDFLEGDPDKPIIVGRVYNGQNMPPLRPEDRIQNVILTPYQHKMMFDDKGASIKLNTGGNQSITMTDGGDTGYGNHIEIKTSDNHEIDMASGEQNRIIIISANDNFMNLSDERRAIHIQTTDRHYIQLSDQDQWITLVTTGGHSITMSDADNLISVVSNSGHHVTISDADNAITISDSSGGKKIDIDCSAGDITISTDTGAINLEAPVGGVNISGSSVNIEATMNMDLNAKLNITSQAGIQNKVAGTMVNLEAAAINTIVGGLVKIN